MGGLDVLIHCAAKMQAMRPAIQYTREDQPLHPRQRHVGAPFLVDQVACRLMQEYGAGVIVNYSSETALSGGRERRAVLVSEGGRRHMDGAR